MKITLEFEHPHELTELLAELASRIEQTESCCEGIMTPMTPSEMWASLRYQHSKADFESKEQEPKPLTK
jgi:hypothetical protein